MDDQILFELNPNPMLIYARESQQIVKVNKEFCDVYKYTPDEIASKELTIDDIHLQDDCNRFRKQLESGNIEKDHNANIWQHCSKENDLFYMKVAACELLYKSEPSILVSMTEVTQLVEAREKLRKSEALFRKLFTNAPQAMVMVDANNKVQQINNSFENLFGYKTKELLGYNLNKIIKAREGYKKAPKISNRGRGEKLIYSELKRYTKAGKEVDLMVSGIPVYLEGELIAGFGIYMDITSQKETQHKIEQSLAEKRVLLEEVHHRVKNNLAIVSGLLQMQILHVDDDRLTKYIQNSQLRIQSMALVHEMLYKSNTLSQIQMSGYAKQLTAVISDTLNPNDKVIKTKVESEDFILNVNQAIPCALIINELISNAFEFAFNGCEEGIISIRLCESNGIVCAKVQDNGIGLPDNFEEMRHKSLGISLIENLCKQLGTAITIESGEWGTCFSFSFPKKDIAGSSSLNRLKPDAVM